MRTGLPVKKIGMSSIYKNGSRIGVTMLQLDENCQVVGHKTFNKHGYDAIQVGYGEIKAKNVTKPLKEFFVKQKVSAKKSIKEFRILNDEAFITVGQAITANHFVIGQYVDATATTIGKGFAGGMKRWNFRGLEASHGVSVSHRSIGSTGQRQDPGKVFKGKKMPGHMGHTKVTMQNLEVLLIDVTKNLIFVKGSVPGAKNSYVMLKDSIKHALPENAPFPTAINTDTLEESSNES